MIDLDGSVAKGIVMGQFIDRGILVFEDTKEVGATTKRKKD